MPELVAGVAVACGARGGGGARDDSANTRDGDERDVVGGRQRWATKCGCACARRLRWRNDSEGSRRGRWGGSVSTGAGEAGHAGSVAAGGGAEQGKTGAGIAACGVSEGDG